MFQVADVTEVGTADGESRFRLVEGLLPAGCGVDRMLEEDGEDAVAGLDEFAGALGLCADGRRRGDDEDEADDEYFDFDDDEEDEDEDEDFHAGGVDDEDEEEDGFEDFPEEDEE